MMPTLDQAVSAGGVTFLHVFPLSRVIQTGPSFDPVQNTPGSRRDERIEYSAAYTSSPVMSRVIGSRNPTKTSASGFAAATYQNSLFGSPPSLLATFSGGCT